MTLLTRYRQLTIDIVVDLVPLQNGAKVKDGTVISLSTCDATDPHQKWEMGGEGKTTPNGTIYSPTVRSMPFLRLS